MPYLVDGNNLAHTLGLSNEGVADRAACARTVATFCRLQGAKATLVFDGPAPRGPLAPGQTPRVRVLFSEALSADDLILRLLGEAKAPRDFTVVTSDRPLGDKARHRGATVERCHEFARRLQRSPKTTGRISEKPSHKVTAEEVTAWLNVFDPERK